MTGFAYLALTTAKGPLSGRSSLVVPAVAGSVGMLIAARASMGIGGAMLMPSTLAIITDMFRAADERQRAIGVWAATTGLGVSLGPIVGGCGQALSGDAARVSPVLSTGAGVLPVRGVGGLGGTGGERGAEVIQLLVRP
jgi:MFS family permease